MENKEIGKTESGIVRHLNNVLLSHQDIILESGKLLKVFWKDRTINRIMERMVD